jgi:hypothetical protein
MPNYILYILLIYSASNLTFDKLTETPGVHQINCDSSYFRLDSNLHSSIKNEIQLISGKHYSEFTTNVKAKFYLGGNLSDSIMDNSRKLASWYSNSGDTIDIVVHTRFFENEAFFVRFIGNKHKVFFYRASHDFGNKRFGLNLKDSLVNFVEVPAVCSQLVLSEIPNISIRPVVYGHIKMTSGTYYDNRDSILLPHHAQLEFYFRSQYYGIN